MKAILVATIGTRDLMFQVSSGEWYNIGDDQMRQDIIGEQAEVLADLGLDFTSYRELTFFLLQRIEQYRDRLKPVIIGKLLSEKAEDLSSIYLIGTDQKTEVKERNKDTCYACELIKDWLDHSYPHLSTQIILLGQDGINPSNFEMMFQWWRNTWRTQIVSDPQQPIWVCLKGGVGQTSESARVSGLSLYGDRIQFFEFQQNPTANRSGIPSDYFGPFQGTNYLWDRTQQQAIKLLKHYDYAAVQDLLQSHFQQDASKFGAIPNLVNAGVAWNQGQFPTFFRRIKSLLSPPEQHRERNFWWQAYEQAYLAVVRLEQDNATEAMQNSFRAVEGLLWEWMFDQFQSHIEEPPRQYPRLNLSIFSTHPHLKAHLEPCFLDREHRQMPQTALTGWVQQRLLEGSISQTVTSPDFQVFWSEETRNQRNFLAHRLGGITREELFAAWGSDIHDETLWQTRILNCLNPVTGQNFKSLQKASLFHQCHDRLMTMIAQL